MHTLQLVPLESVKHPVILPPGYGWLGKREARGWSLHYCYEKVCALLNLLNGLMTTDF